MTRKSSLALLSIVAVLAAGVGLWLQNRPPRVPAKPETIKVSYLDGEKIRRIELTSERGTIAIDRSGGAWRADYPHPVALWPPAVNNVIFAFTRLDALRLVSADPGELGQFGLATPRAKASAVLADGSRSSLLLGAMTPARDGCYLIVEGDRRLYVISKTIADYLMYALPDLRVRRVNPLNLEKLRYLFARSDQRIMEIREKEGRELTEYALTYGNYLMSRPYRKLRGLSSERFPGFLLNLDEFVVEDFVDDLPDGLRRYGLDKPWGEVDANDGKADLHVLFGDRDGRGNVYFKEADSPSVYAIAESRTDFLRSFKAFEYVDKYIYMPEMKDLDRVEIVRSGKKSIMAILARAGPGEGNAEDGTTPGYYIDEREVAPEKFKSAFLGIVGLYAEGETARDVTAQPEVEMRFIMKTGSIVKVEYRPYDRTFYAVFVDGLGEFAISRSQLLSAIQGVGSL